MNLLLFFLFVPIHNLYNKLTYKIRFPIWHKSNIKCITDDDCPMPFACCHDPFFPLRDKYCCRNYTPFRIEDAQSNCSNPFISARVAGILNENWCKNRSLKYAYVNNYIENRPS